jgi:dihydrofolate synthase/folylpolyglutamate synthase
VTAHAYLDSLIQFGQKLGLDSIRVLCAALGHPERAFSTLLVAGTNGKGSVAAYLDHAARTSGLSAGRYTSPHLVRVNERITVGGRDITDGELEEDVTAVREAVEPLIASGALAAPPTYFEALTAAAFVRFRRARVDVAVLEVGMGGRLDATNVSEPLVSAIVSIALDHTVYLGPTTAAIAREKAGVMRKGRATVIGPLPADARAAVQEEAGRVGARLVEAASGVEIEARGDELSVTTPRRRYEHVRPLPGAHQRDNGLVALRVLEEAAAAGLPLDLDTAAAGLSGARWPGRLQWIPGDVPLLLDGAHNVAAAQALAEYLRTIGPFVLVFAAMRDKAFPEMARILFPLAREVVITQPAIARAATVEEILEVTAGLGPLRSSVAQPAAALLLAREKARAMKGSVVVAGSLYLVGEVMAALEA